MTVSARDEFVRPEKSIELYRSAIRNLAEFNKTDKRTKTQLMRRLASLEKEAGDARSVASLP